MCSLLLPRANEPCEHNFPENITGKHDRHFLPVCSNISVKLRSGLLVIVYFGFCSFSIDIWTRMIKYNLPSERLHDATYTDNHLELCKGSTTRCKWVKVQINSRYHSRLVWRKEQKNVTLLTPLRFLRNLCRTQQIKSLNCRADGLT